ncbi:hypothetical protein AB0L82_35375 [Nocardia sp. NPDC052001]|uniref:hypothetical protein n=1 Tax=Nocardia sp. NPDC052001 TaxID=3154853 RepID=UPI00343F0D43
MGVSWPSAFLGAVIVVAGLCYHYLLILHGMDPTHASYYLLSTAVPLTALVLPTSSVGAVTRSVCRAAAVVLGRIGNGGTQ